MFEINTPIGNIISFLAVTPYDAFSFKAIGLTFAPFWLALIAKYSAYSMLLNLSLFVKEEEDLREARAWYSRFYSPNSKTFEDAKNTMEW